MKADHRHELKTNELADWLAHFPQWAKDNRSTLIGAAVILVVAIGVYFFRFYRKDVVGARHQERLTSLVTQLPGQKGNVAQTASQGTDQSYVLLPIAQDLQDFAQGADSDGMAALAWIKRAETLRAELHYRLGDVPREEVARQIGQAQSSYSEALKRATSNASLAATAQFGLGLCDEELGDFEKAAAAYRAVAENADYAGTAAQAAAAYRLKTMDDYKGAVVFKPAPQPKPEAASLPSVQMGPRRVDAPTVIPTPNDVRAVPTPVGVPESNDVPKAIDAVEVPEVNQPAGG